MNVCKKCGVEYEAGSVFCRNCGAKIEVEVNVPEQKNDNSNVITNTQVNSNVNKKSSVVPTIISVAVVVIVGAMILIPKFTSKEPRGDYYEQGANNITVDKNDMESEQKLDVVNEPENKVSSYSAYASDVTWYEASQNALNQGGYLVCINDREEFEKVCSLADEKNIKVFWVGAKRSSSNNWSDTKWVNGEKIIYTNWFSGEPTYYSEKGEDENYLMVFKVNGVWYYNDAINDVAQYYSGKMGYIVETEE